MFNWRLYLKLFNKILFCNTSFSAFFGTMVLYDTCCISLNIWRATKCNKATEPFKTATYNKVVTTHLFTEKLLHELCLCLQRKVSFELDGKNAKLVLMLPQWNSFSHDSYQWLLPLTTEYYCQIFRNFKSLKPM